MGNTNLIPTELKHLLPEWPSQVAKRDNPAQGHKSHLCHLSPCGQGIFLCQAGVLIPGKWDSTETLSQSLGNFSLLCFHSQKTLSNCCNYLLLPEAVRKGHRILQQMKGAFGSVLGKAAKGFTVPQSSLTPHPKKSQFLHKSRQKELPQPRGESTIILLLLVAPGMGCGCVREQRRHPKRRETAKCLRGSRERLLLPLPKPREQRKLQRCATEPSVSQGRGVVSLLSHDEFITADSLDLAGGRDGAGGFQGVRQHGASRRGRGNAFLGPFLQIWWEGRKETGGISGQGWSCQGAGNAG